jgi:hypothetical protein
LLEKALLSSRFDGDNNSSGTAVKLNTSDSTGLLSETARVLRLDFDDPNVGTGGLRDVATADKQNVE